MGKVYLFNLLTSEDEPVWTVTGQNELDQLGYEIDFIIGNTGENAIVVSAQQPVGRFQDDSVINQFITIHSHFTKHI